MPPTPLFGGLKPILLRIGIIPVGLLKVRRNDCVLLLAAAENRFRKFRGVKFVACGPGECELPDKN
jgi:hypothetical protein